MKRWMIILPMIVCVSLLSVHPAHGQLVRKGLKLGYNFSTLTGDVDDAQTLDGIVVGIGLEFNLLLFAVEADLLYSPQGANFPDNKQMRLGYLSIPILLKKRLFPVGIRPYVLAGPEFCLLLSEKSDATLYEGEIRRNDTCAVIGAGVELTLGGKGVYVEGRYSYGLSNIHEVDSQTIKNKVARIFVGIFL